MTIADTYKFYLTLPVQGEVEIFPSNDTLKWSSKPYKDECFFRKELTTDLVIDDRDIFAIIWELKKDKCTCTILPFRMEKKCCEGEFEDYYEGLFALTDGEWNPERCKVTVKMRMQDEYSCLIRDWSTEKNFLEITDRVEASTLGTDGATVCISRAYTNYPPSAALDVALMISLAEGITVPFGFNWSQIRYREIITEDNEARLAIDFCRLESATPPTDPTGWTLVDGIWVKPLPYGSYSVTYGNGNNGFGSQVNTITRDLVDFQTDNGITFRNFIEFYLSPCFENVCSNFFGINPDDSAPNNLAYQCAKIDLWNLVIFQSFEIIAQLADNAVVTGSDEQLAGVKAYKKIWADLRRKFNLCQWYDKDADCFRIEHISYRRASRVLDLTKAPFRECLIGTGNFTTDPIDVPVRETLSYKYDTGDIDFNGGNITYEPDCSNPDEDTNEDNEVIECFLNDLTRIYRNEDIERDLSAINNITMLSMNAGVVNNAAGAITGKNQLNGALASANLMQKYWLWDRPQCNGVLNGNSIQFISTEPVCKNKIEVTLDCSIYDQINPEIMPVKGLFGICKILSMDREEPSCKVSFDLGF